jgi:site-specific DNA-methyltransferase (adenine-specific)
MNKVFFGDCRDTMRDLIVQGVKVQMCVTSPPYYWQRDYGHPGQIGMEPTPSDYVATLVEVFRLARELLADDGVFWLNIGDSYYSGNGQPTGRDPRSPSRDWMRKIKRPLDTPGLGWPKKSLLGIPWMVAHALQADGWTLRSDVIWCRKTAFSEPSVKDRPHRQHEYLFLLSKSRRYYFDRDALPEESVWHIPHARGVKGHSAPFPEELARRCIESGSQLDDTVLDPFIGSGTTGKVAGNLGRQWIGCELNPDYAPLQRARTAQCALAL